MSDSENLLMETSEQNGNEGEEDQNGAEQEQELRDALSVSNEKKRAVFEKYGIEPGKRKGREQKSKLSRDDRKALRSEMKTIKEETDTEISGILSDSQMEKFRKMKKEKKAC